MAEPKTPASGLVMVGAFMGMAVAHLLTTVSVEGELPVFAIVIELILVALAAVTLTRRRWAYAVGAAIAALFTVLTLIGSIDRLANPGDPAFAGLVPFILLGLVAAVAGVLSYRRSRAARSPG